jgi:anti-anti-sigma regulatory factor
MDEVPHELKVSYLIDRVGLRLAGDVDISSVDVIHSAIAALPAGATEIHLEVAELEFIDVSAVRELVALTSAPSGPQLILHDPPPVLQRLIDLIWPTSNTRLVIEHSPDAVHRGTGRSSGPARGLAGRIRRRHGRRRGPY